MESTSSHSSYWSFPAFFIGILEDYGWYLVILSVLLVYMYSKYRPSIDRYLNQQADKRYTAEVHKNPDLIVARLAAQQAVADKLQRKYAEDALQHQQRMEEKELKKREEWLARHPSNGEKLGTQDKLSLKTDYNPLMGDSSRSYRAQKKSACSSGGCGKK